VHYFVQREGDTVWLCHVVPFCSNSTSRVWRRLVEQCAEPECRFDFDSRADCNTCSIYREQYRASSSSGSTYCYSVASER
jgi:hypothetical protein